VLERRENARHLLVESVAGLVEMVEPGARIVGTERLLGGISGEVVRVDAVRPDGTTSRFVIRRARGLETEHEVLRWLEARGIAAPRARLLDGESLVLDYIEGAPRYEIEHGEATAIACAEFLHRLHAIPDPPAWVQDQTEWVSHYLERDPGALDESIGEGRTQAALRRQWPPVTATPAVLVHGDVWPGNLIWDGDRLAAVIDWEDAVVGDPLIDVAVARLDLLWAFGPDCRELFTERYFELADIDPTALPVWDLVTALRPAGNLSVWASGWPACGRPDITAATMRERLLWSVDDAISRLADRS
jgi:aminoglycoside phosphotransferase (APT) family kinase protein